MSSLAVQGGSTNPRDENFDATFRLSPLLDGGVGFGVKCEAESRECVEAALRPGSC